MWLVARHRYFCDSLVNHLKTNERVEEDDRYISEAPRYVKCPKSFVNPKKNEEMQKKVHARHETVNKRFKHWGILSCRFWHSILKHADMFCSVAIITQVAIELGEPLFDVEYHDDLTL